LILILIPWPYKWRGARRASRSARGGRFFYLFEAIDASLKVEVHGGDAIPQMLTVVVVRRPWVKDLHNSGELSQAHRPQG
jgi:hypothetical protein